MADEPRGFVRRPSRRTVIRASFGTLLVAGVAGAAATVLDFLWPRSGITYDGIHHVGNIEAFARGGAPTDGLDGLLRAADAAMYQAKAEGKHRWLEAARLG